MEKLKIYLCGPISGRQNLNKEEFAEWQRIAEDLGYKVINPHQLNPNFLQGYENLLNELQQTEYVWRMYMNECVKAIADCNVLVTLPEWEESRGARVEVQLARGILMPVVHCYNLPKFNSIMLNENELIIKS